MKIYTKTGDDGTTSLFGGGRVPKHHARIEAYGTVDELNSCIGSARAAASDQSVDEALSRIQNDLFVLGSDLATPLDARNAAAPRIDAAQVQWLEARIDGFDSGLAPLRFFVLPAGCETAVRLHIARTVCRRAERLVVQLAAAEAINTADILYLNRLSDFLFVLARVVNRLAGVADVPWKNE